MKYLELTHDGQHKKNHKQSLPGSESYRLRILSKQYPVDAQQNKERNDVDPQDGPYIKQDPVWKRVQVGAHKAVKDLAQADRYDRKDQPRSRSHGLDATT